ncbi:alanine--tRNA ligase [Actinomadura hibisca]|uniref:alanine--tRNA ligase n=1 Tax=Actinomadura hibisca TaxID=68565 RepID=UPI000829F9DE|nr:alanine--tRNA ligase [Actinomadura hibisca]
MRSADIRSTFLDFFRERDHRVVPSSPLVPSDPTLLLTNAGMNQFKPCFLGERTPPHRRMASVQKCARTSDIGNVGRTSRHGTFFEMLGNFSFGDYFKDEIIPWSWELLTRHYGLDPGRLWVTVYLDDDEAERVWRRIGVPAERIQRLGMANNHWSMGVPGPCGPSSELHYDRGPAFGREGGPAVDGERYQELWNLVFMQSLRGPGGDKDGYPIVGKLPTRNIDTGLGLDRLAAILQGVDSICETDLVAPTLLRVQELAGRAYRGRGGGEESVSFRIVAEHARSIVFLIADGALPSPDGAGYVVRRLARRAIQHARLLGVDEPVLPLLTGSVVDTLGEAWPELVERRELIRQVVTAEEEGFERTVRHGSRVLESAIRKADGVLPARTVFELNDTRGFPVELALDAARSAGLTVDEDELETLLEQRRSQAREGGRDKKNSAVARQDLYRGIVTEHGPTTFVGYETTTAETRLLALLGDTGPVASAGPGERIEVVLDRTPFYAEAGGQIGDTGTLRTGDGALLRVLDTRHGMDDLHVHTVQVLEGEVRPGTTAEAVVDADRRAAIARSHSATHVLHAMMRRVLGEHATQRGSRVEPGRLRFDFAHFAPLGRETLRTVQTLVNDYLLADPEVRVWEADRATAEEAGALALFGERYGDRVRIVDIGAASRELCGGTHVAHGAQAGPVHLLGESSVGTGLRRVEALTGPDALRHVDHQQVLLAELADLLQVPADDAPGRLRQRLEVLAKAQRNLEKLRAADLGRRADGLVREAERLDGGWLVARAVPDVSGDDLRPLAARVLERRPGAVVLGTADGGRALLVAAVTSGAVGVPASALLREAARAVGGGTGGKGAVANAGGRRPEKLGEAIELAARTARRTLTG